MRQFNYPEKIIKSSTQSIPDLSDEIAHVNGKTESQWYQNLIESFNQRIDISGVARLVICYTLFFV